MIVFTPLQMAYNTRQLRESTKQSSTKTQMMKLDSKYQKVCFIRNESVGMFGICNLELVIFTCSV